MNSVTTVSYDPLGDLVYAFFREKLMREREVEEVRLRKLRRQGESALRLGSKAELAAVCGLLMAEVFDG